MSIKSKIITSLFILIVVVISILYYPFLNFQSHVKNNSPSQELVVTSLLNPFRPKVSEIVYLQSENAYWITVIDYERTSLFEFKRGISVNGQVKPIDLEQINAKIQGKSLTEVKNITKQQDLSKTEYIPEISTLDKEYKEEQKKPVEC